jgi:hypothetical protein
MRILTAAVILAFMSTTSSGQSTTVTKADAPKCSASQQRDWILATKDMLGMVGQDSNQASLGSVPVNRIWRKNWWPLQDKKIPMCGRLHHFDWHAGDVVSGEDEQDWNNFLIPTGIFHQIFQDGFPADTSQVWKCGEEYCMEAEITPNSKFYENQWWSKKMKTAQLTGKELCAYGPFVEEEWHGKRPEIHPSELYWWDDGDSRWMLLQEDASQRFDERGHYANLKQAPSGWQPWAQAPRHAEFRIAFELDGSRMQANYFINERNSFNAEIVEPPDPKVHTLKFDETAVTVTEVGAVSEHIKVSFVDLCLTEPNKLQGYVAIAAAVGLEKASGAGGHEMLEITTTPVAGSAPTTEESSVVVRAETPSLTIVNGQASEIGNLLLQARPSGLPSGNVSRFGLSGLAGSAVGKNLSLPATGGREELRGIDAVKGTRLEIETQSGEKKTLEIPPLGLAMSIKQQPSPPSAIEAAPANTAALVKVAGGEYRSDVVLKSLQHKELRLAIAVHYAPLDNGEINAEDSSPFSERLNSVLAKNDPSQITKALGTMHPFKAEWKFEGLEFFPDGTSKPFPVVLNGPSTENQIGTRWHSQSLNPTLDVEFPSGNGRLFKVVAIGIYTDRSGATGRISNEIWNQEILSPLMAIDDLLNAVVSISGLTESAKNALLATKYNVVDPMEYLGNADARRADLLRLQAERVSQTGRVSIADFRDLVSKAKSLSAGISQ